MKLKTNKAVAKRINSKNSFFLRKKAYKGHLLRKKSPKQLRKLSRCAKIHSFDTFKIRLMLPYMQ